MADEEKGQVEIEVPEGLERVGSVLLNLLSEIKRQQYFHVKVKVGERGRWRWMSYDEDGEYRGMGTVEGYAEPADAVDDARKVMGSYVDVEIVEPE